MAKATSMMAFWLMLLLILKETKLCYSSVDVGSGRKAYIVYLGDAPATKTRARAKHHSILSSVIKDHYLKSFDAFAAYLLPDEAMSLSDMDEVISVFPNTVRKLHVTRSWDYLGFPMNAKRSKTTESNVVIGFLDTGIWPDNPSFSDAGLGPPPSKWKGKCQSTTNFTCNNKIIGARYYHLGVKLTPPDIDSPVDSEGHGTHTSSTATGAVVPHASLYGLADGTARGAVPSARIAMYKVCWYSGCQDVDMLAAFDQAIYDGVDVISASIGGPATDYLSDVLAVGPFHAMKRGIVTCLSGGNDGPILASVSNIAPWVITVAASSIDRQFRTEIELGNGQKTRGISINTYDPPKKNYPLISGAQAGLVIGSESAADCTDGSLDKKKVMGKIVSCGVGDQPDDTIKALGGTGVIKQGDGELMDVAFTSDLPSVTVDDKALDLLSKYINSTKNAQAIIHKSRAINVTKAFVTSFSSRGPNIISANILKPDISAPGLDILSAWTGLASVTNSPNDKRMVRYNIISGTSMSCPHVAGIAAYVKSLHPNWSAAAIKSAIMTTAKNIESAKMPDMEYAYGAGMLNPLRAADPGLVYDIHESEYIRFLCREGYNTTMIKLLEGNNKTHVNCNAAAKRKAQLGSDALNYPSMQCTVQGDNGMASAVFRRTVTNVGMAKSVYRAAIRAPKGMSVEVSPTMLKFDKLRQKRSFKVVVKGGPLGPERQIMSASLVWRDSTKTYDVRSPIVIANSISPPDV